MTQYKAVKVDGVKHDEHRYIMEQYLGRGLTSDEVVHHINGNKRDNDISNLQVMSRAEHARMHQSGYKPSPETLKKLSIAKMGNRCSPRKLAPEQIRFIRENYTPNDPEFGLRALAKKFNTTHSNIHKIVNRRTHQDVY